jgi:radical SAM protein with 4Fe4S-binding SPASM domain
MNLDLHLTTACNMHCSFCGAWEYGKAQAFLPLTKAKEALTQGRTAGYKITTLTGGEPTLHPDYTEILQYAHQLGYWTVVTTNGLRLTEEMLEAYRQCKTLVRISLHTMHADRHAALTGTNSLTHIKDTIASLTAHGIHMGLGATISRENRKEIGALAAFAWKSQAAFIRYTPVVGIRGAQGMALDRDFFKEMLHDIFLLGRENLPLLDINNAAGSRAGQIVRYMLTRRCAGGSHQHMICDCHGTVLPCSFIPAKEGLCCSAADADVLQRFQTVAEKTSHYFSDSPTKGACGDCRYEAACKGGCMTTKIPYGLSREDEQPLCMYQLIEELTGAMPAKDRQSLENYWAGSFLRNHGGRDADRVCMRRLPIWELRFRPGNRDKEFIDPVSAGESAS